MSLLNGNNKKGKKGAKGAATTATAASNKFAAKANSKGAGNKGAIRTGGTRGS